MRQAPAPLPALYLITPDGWQTDRLMRAVDAALRAGARWLQYRDKSNDPHRRLEQAGALVALGRRHGARVIVNDDLELAAQVAADGVHLGEHDDSLVNARRTLGDDALIGVSCYNDMERARAASSAGASYLAFGAFFPSPTKPGARRAEPGLLTAAAGLQTPLCAIGGITAAGAGDLVAAGADLIAVVSAVFDAADPAQATAELLERIAEGWTRRNATRQIAH